MRLGIKKKLPEIIRQQIEEDKSFRVSVVDGKGKEFPSSSVPT